MEIVECRILLNGIMILGQKISSYFATNAVVKESKYRINTKFNVIFYGGFKRNESYFSNHWTKVIVNPL